MNRMLAVLFCLTLIAGVMLAQAPAAGQDRTPSDRAPSQAPDRTPSQASGREAQGASQTWTGHLVDATCKAATPTAGCEASSTTSSYGIMTSDGQFLKFDSSGSNKAKSELQKAKKSGRVSAKVTGSLQGTDTIRVSSITLDDAA